MTAPTLFGATSNEVLAALGRQPVGLAFSQTADQYFAPVGSGGVPDPTMAPLLTYQYLKNHRALLEMAANQKPLIRLADSNMNILTELSGELEATVEELMADSGQAKVVIRQSNWIEDYIVNGITINQDLHLLIDPIPTYPVVDGVTLDWQIRWGGKCKEISVSNHQDGTSTIEFLAVSNREHTKRLLFGAAPWLPPEVQEPQMWLLPGPLRSILFATGFVNLARLFVPGLSFITNAFNPASWINPLNPDALLNINPLSWPIQCAFVNPILDTSMWSVLAATWTDWHSTMADLLSNAGCICRAYTWLTSDATSPHTDLTALINAGGDVLNDVANSIGLSSLDDLIDVADQDFDNLTRPTRNCVVLAFEDKSGVTGPTGTAADGLLELIGVTMDDLITTVIFDQQSQTVVNGEEVIDVDQVTPFFQSLLGVETATPKVIWRDGQFTGLIERSTHMHKGPPLTIMTGGRSPTLVNEAQTFGIKYALSEIQMVLTPAVGVGGAGGSAGSGAGPAPVGSGLDNIYQGQLDNVLLAWERYTDPIRALWTGDLAYQEYIERGGSSAYTVAGWLSLAEGHWKTRPFYGFEAKYFNGRPWVYGVDFQLGDRVGFEQDGIVYVDQLSALRYKYDRKASIALEISIGDDRDKRDPVAGGLRILQGIYSLVGAYMGEGTLFG